MHQIQKHHSNKKEDESSLMPLLEPESVEKPISFYFIAHQFCHVVFDYSTVHRICIQLPKSAGRHMAMYRSKQVTTVV